MLLFFRDTSKHEESIHRISEHEERRCSAVSKGDGITSSGLRDRDAAPRSGKLTIKDDIHSGELSVETFASSKYDMIAVSDDLVHQICPREDLFHLWLLIFRKII